MASTPAPDVPVEHSRSCPERPGSDDFCTCALLERQRILELEGQVHKLLTELSDAEASGRLQGAAEERERLTPVLDAFALAEKYVDCGDNSCMFKKPGAGGMRTNGGCRCVDRGSGRPFVAAALSKLYKAVAALTPPAEPLPQEKPEPCSECGGYGYLMKGHPPVWVNYPNPCERCRGSGK